MQGQTKSETSKEYNRRRYLFRKEYHNKASRDWYVANKEHCAETRRRRLMLRKYGLTIADYDQMWAAQGGVCKICRKPETRVSPKTGRVYLLAVDHDKTTKKVGGLLCAKCNKAIGVFDHNPEWLDTAASYIRERNKSDS